jgi:hypothetical protein
MKLLITLSLLCALVFVVPAQSKKKKPAKRKPVVVTKPVNVPKPKVPPTGDEPQDAGKLLASGTDSKVDKPFIFVARSAETYAEMQKLVGKLPSVGEIDFTKQAVVAAFAGEKFTAGFSVGFTKTGEKNAIGINEPAADAMVAQMITTPYKVVAIQIDEDKPLQLETSKNWYTATSFYTVTSGTFEFSGGYVGRTTTFPIEGKIGVMKYENYITLNFDLTGTEAQSQRKMSEISSGTVSNGLNRLDVGTLSDGPKPPVTVKGTFSDDKFLLKFEPNLKDWHYNDAFEGRGNLEATKLKMR